MCIYIYIYISAGPLLARGHQAVGTKCRVASLKIVSFQISLRYKVTDP